MPKAKDFFTLFNNTFSVKQNYSPTFVSIF